MIWQAWPEVVRGLACVLGCVGVVAGMCAGPVAAARASGLPGVCASLAAARTHAAITAYEPRPGSPRIFAMQYEQAPRSVVSYASFRAKIDCMLRTYVLPHRARNRPNVVVFNEDIGLATLAIGSRGTRGRALFTLRTGGCGTTGAACGAIGALGLITSAYAGPVAAYARRFTGFTGLSRGFVAATDTIVRSFMATFSAEAKRYGLYMIGSADIAPFTQSRAPSDLATFSDPDLHPRPASVYVATAPQVYNEVFMWGPRDVRRAGPDVMRNIVASNLKVPLTGLEVGIGLTPGPSHGPAAIANLRPYALPGTHARIGFATSLPAFTFGSPGAAVNSCSDTSLYYMRCLDRLGANLVIQDEANPGAWTGPDGNGAEQWQPLSWMGSTYRTVADPSVHFDYNVTAMMVGNLGDLTFDGQSAITQRGLGGAGGSGRGCHYIGNASFVPGEDLPVFRPDVGRLPDFVALAPWVVPDASRAALRRVGAELAPGSGSRLEDDYLETALVADLPFPPDPHRHSCAGASVAR